jgi:hypothetical protein
MRDTVISIVTKVPFAGRNFSIVITPLDPARAANIPMQSHPIDRGYLVWRDSIQYLLPDTVLNILRKHYGVSVQSSKQHKRK